MAHMNSMAGALSPRVGIVDFLKLFATYRLLVLRVNYLSLTKNCEEDISFSQKENTPNSPVHGKSLDPVGVISELIL